MRRPVLALAALALLLPAVLPAQSIAARIGATRTGIVWMSFASAKGVCGNGWGQIALKRGDQSAFFENLDESKKEWKDECAPGPVRVSLDLERGAAKPAKQAIFPASIAEGAVVWPRLLKLAKDDARPRATARFGRARSSRSRSVRARSRSPRSSGWHARTRIRSSGARRSSGSDSREIRGRSRTSRRSCSEAGERSEVGGVR